jgi:uncharacterized FlgJ-related protein
MNLFKKISLKDTVTITTLTVFLIGFSYIAYTARFQEPRTVTQQSVSTQIVYDLNDPFSEIKVRDYLRQLHVKYPEVAIAQMKLESANGSSKIFQEGNNLFGMKLAEHRPTTALGEKNGHAYYSHWRQSCIDYAMWQGFVEDPENISSESSWVNYISKFYSKDDSYKQKLLNIRNKLKP